MTTLKLTAVKMSDGTKRLQLFSPYHPSTPTKARAIGGKWNASTKTWLFDPRDEQRVRDLCQKVYGIDPFEPPAELVTVHLPVNGGQVKTDDGRYVPGNAYGADLWAFGRELARRADRDYAVRLGDGVIIVSGGFPSSGGSRKNPWLKPLEGTVLEVRDVPRALAEAEPLATIVDTTPAPIGRPAAPAPDGVGGERPAVAELLEAFRALRATEQARVLELLQTELPTAQ